MWPVPAVQIVGTAQRDVDRKKKLRGDGTGVLKGFRPRSKVSSGYMIDWQYLSLGDLEL